MISLRKSSLLLFAFFIPIILVFAAENERKDKKALIECIKSDFHSWSYDLGNKTNKGDDLHYTNSDEIAPENKLRDDDSENSTKQQSADFRDFECKIVNNQAVVQFTVDEQKISAFFEKVNGAWKLICAAELDDQV